MNRPTRLSAAPRARRRRRQGGAAMVEAAFMLPMFVILWYSSLYVHNLGSKHIMVNMQARQEAWQTAMANCGVHNDSTSERLPGAIGSGSSLPSSGGSDSSAVSTAFNNGSVTGALSGFVSGFTSAISSIFPNPEGAIVNKTFPLSWRVPDLYNKTGKTPQDTLVKGTLTVVCNEAPRDGSISNVISGVFSLLKSII